MFKKNYISILTAFLLSVSGCSGTQTILIKDGSAEQTITVKSGDKFIIQLEGQMSTGYGWKLSEIPPALSAVAEAVTTEEKDITGGIDIQQFTFIAKEKADITLTFKYARHWEKKPKAIKTAVVKIKIE